MALKRQCDARWRIFGTHLGVSSPIMDTIHKDSTGKSTDCMLALLDIWLSEETGTGKLPRCWKTVVKAVDQMGVETLAKEIAKEYGVAL